MFELMNSARHLERRGISAEAANRGFPHVLGGCGEDQVGADIAQQPRGVLELRFELAGSPAGISEDEARARRRIGLEQAAEALGRRRQVEALADVSAAA